MKIILIDNYDSFTYNLFHYISKFKKNVVVVRNDKIDGKTILKEKFNNSEWFSWPDKYKFRDQKSLEILHLVI